MPKEPRAAGMKRKERERQAEELIFSKVLSPVDVGRLDQLVIPKQHAERLFQLDAAAANDKDGEDPEYIFEDRAGKPWRFRCSYWNLMRYILTKEWGDFVKEKCLDAGDTVSFYRSAGAGKAAGEGQGRLLIDYTRKGDCKKDLHLRLHPDPDPAPKIPKQPVESDSFSISILQLPKHPVQQSDSFLQPFPRAPPRPPSQLPLATPTARIELTDPYSPFHLQSSIRRLFQQLVHVRNTNTSSCSCPPNAQAPLSDAWYQTLKYLTCNAQECLQYVYYKMVLTIHGNGESHKKEWSKVSANSSEMTSTTTSPSQFHCGEELRILSTIETLEGSIHHIREICGANLNNCRIMVSLSPSIMYCILLCRGILGIMSISGAEDTNEKQELPVFAFDDLSCHDKVTRVKAQRIPAGVTEPIYLLLTAIRHLLYLDLSGCNGLTQLPASLGTLHNLAALNLSCCSSLHILPPSVGSLQNLQILVLSCCQKLKNLPESICESSKLRLLDLSGCSSLETLPDSFVNLGHLEILNLSECKRLKQLPQPFGSLQGLKSMNLSGCHGVDLDVECVSKLANLKYLTLSTHTSTQCFSYSFRHLGNWLDMSRWWRKNRIHLHCDPKAAVLHLYMSHEQSIINKLLCHGSDNDDATADQIVTSICIVGESGMGKSELVHQIYNDQMILEAFDLRIWVYMCDKKRLLGKIVEFTTCSHYSDAPITVLEEIVIEELTGKRLLLVLDDCDVKMSQYFWNDLRILLNVCAKGSALIVTTKSKEVANLVGAMQTYHLSSLSKEECFMIFKGHVLSGLDVNFNAELESVAWKIVEKCGGNALCVKALSGLFCHSEIGFSEIDMLVGGVLPALRLCYNLLPAHLQQCFKFCSLFPRDYIFTRNHIIRLWIAQGFVFPEESSQPEDIGLHYFDELFCRSFFQRSPFHNDQEDKFVMHELFHDLALSFSKDECFRCEKPFCSLPENISHLSLVLSDFRTVAPSMEVRNLQSFLVVRRSFPVVKIFCLDDLCLKSRFLRSLDLSYTDILELPSSIRNMKHLRLLALNNTKINGLPFEIGQVTTLQTLELKECCHLINLPRSISSLTNLRHLDVRKEQGNVQVGMPHGIGQLTDLQTLAVFYVGNNLLHCSIGELKNLNGLRGHVHITGLENIEKADGAREANIANKHFLQALTLEWSYSDEDMDDDLGKEIGYVILQNLQPNSKLQQLIIRNYPSDLFPVWMQDSYLCKLVSVTLDNCHECNELPCLGDLPSLKNLFIQRMNLIESFGINRNSLATERIYSPRFPSLEVLTLSEMYSLQFWVGTSEGDYPRLCRLSISRCPKLISLPRLNSLVHLSFHFGGPVLPSFSELPLLASLKIEGFQKINFISFPRQIKTLRKLEISDCKELLSVYAYSLSVSELQVVRCPKLDFVGNLMEDRLEQLAVGSRNSSTRRRSIVLKVMTYTDLHDDGWNWKIYHEKDISGSKFSRSYYRCINSGCSATKILQPNDNDPNTLSAMYISDHNHLSQENTPQTV